MWWQYIIVGLVIGLAALFTTRKLINFFENPQGSCDSCSMGGGTCSLEELKREIAAKK